MEPTHFSIEAVLLNNFEPATGPEAWLVKFRHNSKARVRVFYFPYAGGNAFAFSGMEANFSGDVDVFAIQAPGRGQRFHEKPISCLDTYVSLVIKAISPYLNIPFIFIGYSNGSLIAYEVARRLQSLYGIAPVHLVLAARRAPNLPQLRPSISNMNHDDLLYELRRYSRTPEEILRDEEVMSLFIPMLRADFALGELALFETKPVLKLDATLFWGRQDEDTSEEGIRAWFDLIEGEVNVVEFQSGHFFCYDEEETFASGLGRIVEKVRDKYVQSHRL